jgi:SSS family solute:Na+ symporter
VFLLTVYWKRTTRKAVNFTLSAGSAFSLGVGATYLWILTPDKFPYWPHYLLLSFYIFAFLFVVAMVISLLDKSPAVYLATQDDKDKILKPTIRVKVAWTLLCLVMVVLYWVFK